ncbi:CaiB/BaiF CoA transferase family protein [Sandaracinobacteroides saxicola]|uniref:CoA transferase n=1 Tax=Sandaracinobacteroides saxicola TaxID=2759707 RepID=A0A7G5ILS1_9SPHN|nr:CaiB/BaiF CoA-transferase family protein [Sandaracinobacteroides saxicola]QMW24313.1 CoA transferase [Sandaracinobacteroides saxicola]
MDDAPLRGLKVVEFTHMVMGPAVGAVLADLGAEVVKVEPMGGDATRRLLGSGAGYFPMYNRGKKSICLNLKSADGLGVARDLAAGADVLVENFRPGALDRLGLGYEALAALNPRLIYCTEKGFLPGPYEERTALDEVAQMMGGLAYMTGPPGRPLRAGASVIDVAGGMFGVIGVLAALERRHRTGKGGKVASSLFETTVYLVGQHMAQKAVTGVAAAPMPARVSAWAIYDVFETADDDAVFVGVVTDALWEKFCALFDLPELWANDAWRANNARVRARDAIMPVVRARLKMFTKAELIARLDGSGLPFAPIGRPEELFEDPHLLASGGLRAVELPDGTPTLLPVIPVEVDGVRAAGAQTLTMPGQDTRALLAGLGRGEAEVAALFAAGAVG